MGTFSTFKDLTGQRFGKLLVIDISHKDKNRTYHWNCKCDCGNYVSVRGPNLRNGHSQSCGSCNLSGQIFGRLTVVRQIGIDAQSKQRLWECKCICQKIILVPTNHLTLGNTKSCGCLRSETSSKHMKETVKNFIGSGNPNYNHNMTDEERLQKRTLTLGYKEWAYQVKVDADFTCTKCKARGGRLASHHIESYSIHKSLRLELTNGACLCEQCHRTFHKIYGIKNNTRQQFNEYCS